MSVRSHILFLLCLLIFAEAPLFAQPTRTEGYSEFTYDKETLKTAGALSTVSDINTFLATKLGVRTLEIPNSQKPARSYPSEAWTYFHYPDVHKAQGAYLRAFTSALISTDQSPSGFHKLEYKDRPYGTDDLILFRTGSQRVILLHELMHHLIADHERKASKVPAREWQRDLELLQREGESLVTKPGGVNILEYDRMIRIVIDVSTLKLKEEMAINMTLLKQREELGLNLSELQGLLYRMQWDPEQYLDDLLETFETTRAELTPEMRPQWEPKIDEMKALLLERKNAAFVGTKNFLDDNLYLRRLARFVAKDIYIHDPVLDSPNLQERLGIESTVELDLDTLKDIRKHWSYHFHPDRDKNGESKFKVITAAAEKIEYYIQNPEAARREQIAAETSSLRRQASEQMAAEARRIQKMMTHLKRFSVRLLTTCAVGAAYCATDHLLPWSYPPHDQDFFWAYFLGSATVSAFTTTTNQEMDSGPPLYKPGRQGLRQGIKRGLIIAVCSELIKALAR